MVTQPKPTPANPPKDETKPDVKPKPPTPPKQPPKKPNKKKCLDATESNIKNVLKSATELATQKGVSLPVIAIYVGRVENGETNLEVEMNGQYILDGHHSFVVAKLCRLQPKMAIGTLSHYHKSVAIPIRDIKIDQADWGNR